MRLFFAITLTEDIIERVAQQQGELRKVAGEDGIRWTRPDQFHYTVKFLGEQIPPRASKAVEVAHTAASSVTPFTLTLGGVSAFPNIQRPSVIWAGATEGQEAFSELALYLERRLIKSGFKQDNKPATAHLTLGRVKGYTGEIGAVKALKTVKPIELGSMVVDRFVLIHSTLTPSGSIYQVVDEFPFGQKVGPQ